MPKIRAPRTRTLVGLVVHDLARDDLFVRLFFLVVGGIIAALGVSLTAWSLVSVDESIWLLVFTSPLGVLIAACGLVLLLRAVVPAESKAAETASELMQVVGNGASDGLGAGDFVDAALGLVFFWLIVLVLTFPIVVATLALHAVGIMGQPYGAGPRTTKLKPVKKRRRQL